MTRECTEEGSDEQADPADSAKRRESSRPELHRDDLGDVGLPRQTEDRTGEPRHQQREAEQPRSTGEDRAGPRDHADQGSDQQRSPLPIRTTSAPAGSQPANCPIPSTPTRKAANPTDHRGPARTARPPAEPLLDRPRSARSARTPYRDPPQTESHRKTLQAEVSRHQDTRPEEILGLQPPRSGCG